MRSTLKSCYVEKGIRKSEVQHRPFTFPMPSLERCSPSSALSQEVLSAPELPGADCTLQKRRSLQRLKEQPASTSPTTSPKRVIIDSLTFLTRKGYAIHDSSGLPASKNAPTKLSALKWGPKIHSTKSVEIEGVSLNNHPNSLVDI